MEETRTTPQMKPPRWVGIDWGKDTHSVCVVDDGRKKLAAFSVPAAPQGYAQLAGELARLAPIGGIAVEATRNLLIAFLTGAGFTVYLVNPKMSKSWRDTVSIAGVKSDARDGHVLALELSRRHESLEPYTPGDPATAELATLCKDRRSLVDERTALVQRLQATLAQYHPAALAFFEDWTSRVAWRFLKKFPAPATLARARKDTLIRFLKSNRIGLKPIWLERIEHRGDALAWPLAPDANALQIKAEATVAQLQALQPHIDRYDTIIQEKTKALPQAELIATIDGAGPILTPELTAILTDPAASTGGYQALRTLAGAAPVTHQSGKKRHAAMRRRCNKTWRNTLHLFAFSSTKQSRWAKAYYDIRKEHGDSHGTALRKLADKWLRILTRMIEHNEPYDEQRHIESLRKSNSPVYKKLCEFPCG
jgi:transposase